MAEGSTSAFSFFRSAHLLNLPITFVEQGQPIFPFSVLPYLFQEVVLTLGAFCSNFRLIARFGFSDLPHDFLNRALGVLGAYP